MHPRLPCVSWVSSEYCFSYTEVSLQDRQRNPMKRYLINQFLYGLVGAGHSDYDRDYIFATVQTLNRDEHLQKYEPDAFDCIILDEAHHSSANTYQKVMNYFTPKLWLGMTATPDKRDDDIEEKIFTRFLIIRLHMRFVCSRPWRKTCCARSTTLE